jgi:putative flippase GtrA
MGSVVRPPLRVLRLRMPLILRRAWSVVADLVVGYALKFGVVGVFGYLIDVGVFNALRVDTGDGPVLASSFWAKAVSVSVATLATWIGNRYWTFRDRRRTDFALELVEFAAISGVGMAIALACLYVSHHVFGARSLVADNIAANGVGLVLGTLFRFLMYRYWVYGDHRVGTRDAPEASSPHPNRSVGTPAGH